MKISTQHHDKYNFFLLRKKNTNIFGIGLLKIKNGKRKRHLAGATFERFANHACFGVLVKIEKQTKQPWLVQRQESYSMSTKRLVLGISITH